MGDVLAQAPVVREVAEREGTEAALLLHSAPLALACTLLAVLRPGDHLLVSAWLRPETRQFFEQEAPTLGYEVDFLDPDQPRGWRQALRTETRLLFVEAPVLATTRLVDLRPLRALTREAGIAFLVDASAASSSGFRPVDHGADLVLHDAAVLLDAEGDGAVGVVCGTESVVEEVARRREVWGAAPTPHAIARLERGLATLDLRLARQTATARTLAETLAATLAAGPAGGHADEPPPSLTRVRSVYYPTLPTHPDRAVAEALLRQGGHRLLLDLEDEDAVDRLCTLFPAPLEAPATDSSAAAIPGTTQVTLAVGLEPVDAVLAQLHSALA